MDVNFDSAEQLPPGHGAESGLASALLGAAVFLASPMVAIPAAQVWAHGG